MLNKARNAVRLAPEYAHGFGAISVLVRLPGVASRQFSRPLFCPCTRAIMMIASEKGESMSLSPMFEYDPKWERYNRSRCSNGAATLIGAAVRATVAGCLE